jgi:glycosyltransferase involved in cell wall biosynthesis
VAGPLVSVLTATHNGEDFLAETIESVLGQTYQNVEHVLVDDGSSDSTVSILRDYAQRYGDRIRILEYSDCLGPTRRRNQALAAAGGSYLAWLDHDDVWLPTKLERQVEVMERDRGVGFVYTQWELFDHGSGHVLERSQISPGGDALRRLFVEGCYVASSSVTWRREAMERRGLAFRDRHFSWGDDHYLWLGLALDSRGELVDETLTRLRRHDANESVRLGERNLYPQSIELLEEFIGEFPEARGRLGSALRRGVAWHYALAAIHELHRGRRARAALYALRAAERDPARAVRYFRGRTARGLGLR